MATAVPIPEYLKPGKGRNPPGEFWEELTYIPEEEELFDPLAGPKGRRRPKTITGGIARMIRKNIADPLYKAGLVTGRARRGQPPTPLELLEVAALGALPRVSGGLGSGPGVAKPFRSRVRFKSTQEAIEFGEKANKKDLVRMAEFEAEVRKESRLLLERKDFQGAMNKATEAQFLREAQEAASPLNKLISDEAVKDRMARVPRYFRAKTKLLGNQVKEFKYIEKTDSIKYRSPHTDRWTEVPPRLREELLNKEWVMDYLTTPY